MIPALPQANSARGSSVAYIKGNTLASTELLEDFLDDFETIFGDVIAEVAADARAEAQKKARLDPVWREYADLIDVEFKDSEFHYVLVGDEDRVREAMRLEFGMPESAPKSLLRKEAASTEYEHSQMLNEMLEAEASVA